MPTHSFPVLNQQFIVDTKYQFIREIGQGAYGVVCAAKNTQTGEDVAIKKVTKVFEKTILAKRALREVKLLRHFSGHENITSIQDMDITNVMDFNEIYLVQELMEADLHQIIRSEQPLTDAHFQYFIYQICRGLKYIHSANVLHRDLKPGNLLVNADCELKICDFGLARGFSDEADSNVGFMTEYVATRWYRAPEIMLSFQSYTKAIDMWSVGCIFAEMLGGKPLFKGRDYVDQLNQILQILGTPDEATLRRVGSERAQAYIRSLPKMPKIHFQQLYPRASPLAIDLLEKLLNFDPAARITVEQALAHPYLAAYHEEDDEPVHEKAFDFAFEVTDRIDEMKRLIAQEVMSYKASKEAALGSQNGGLRRAASLSAADRSATTTAAKNTPHTSERIQEEPAVAEEAPVSHLAGAMEVDEDLERELSGQAMQTQNMTQDSKIKRDDCAVDIPETVDKEEIMEAVIQPSLHDDTSKAIGEKVNTPKRYDSATIVETVEEACSTAPRWYFKANENAEVSEKEPTFECLREYQPPVKVNASDGHTNWRVPTIGYDPGRYMIVLGISTRNVRLEQIEFLSISFSHDEIAYEWCEIITKSRVATMASSDIDVVKWVLHQELHIHGRNETKLVDMEVRTALDAMSADEIGFFDLYYMELHPYRLENDIHDPYLRVHRPYLWSLDMLQQVNQADDISEHPKEVVFMACSGDGNYIATLIGVDNQLIIDLWDLRGKRFSNIDPTASVASLSIEGMPFHPSVCATARIPLMRLSKSSGSFPYTMDVSWNAAQVSLTCYECNLSERGLQLQPFQDVFGVLRYDPQQPTQTQSNLIALAPSHDHLGCSGLKNYRGFGKFHITALQDQRPQNELYITCDGESIEIYGVFRKWTHIRSIPFNTPRPERPDLMSAFPMHRKLCGKYFVWTRHSSDVIPIWNIETGEIASMIIKEGHQCVWPLGGTTVSLSSDGSIIAICREGTMTTHRTDTGILLGSCLLPESHREDCTIHFVNDDAQILITANHAVIKDFGRATVGVILDASDLHVAGWCSMPSTSIVMQHSPSVGSSHNLISVNRTTMDCIRTQDILFQPYSKRHPVCDDNCRNRLTQLKTLPKTQPIEFTSESGLDFKIVTKPTPNGDAIILYMSSGMDGPTGTFVIPPLKAFSYLKRYGNGSTYQTAVIHGKSTRLLINSRTIAMIWSLPETLGQDPVLLLAWSTHDATGYIHEGGWFTCPHQQIHCRYKQKATLKGQADTLFIACMHVDRVFEPTYAKYFLGGIVELIDVYQFAEGPCRNAIIQYTSKYINHHPIKDEPETNVLSIICKSWAIEAHDTYKRFAADLLGPSNQRWIPRPGSNPLPILLEKAEKEPRALGLVKIIVDSCIRNARDENNDSNDPDPSFLSPFVSCLHDMLEQEAPLPELASIALRKMAYIPVRCRSFIVDYHIIAHPPEFRWQFWKANPTLIYERNDPILQLAYTTDDRDPRKDNFTRDLFVASFDWLWIYKDTAKASSKLQSGIQPPVQPPSWLSVFFHLTLHKCRLSASVKVESHLFKQESFDNPALAALVEYKWNTIGSIYNIIDLAAFALPLAGSINQLLIILSDGDIASNTGVLSFSVLFIFLHFLFELRVSSRVCQFVAIIIRIFGEIRVFLLIFTGGILAFAIAILHLLHSCPAKDCSTAFPTHFYEAVSSTYFFMGGRYDSINDELDSDNWAFLTMMIIYFFFTVILMLNVLIGLINVAFNDGDKTWRLIWLENRLRYIESAENITFHIPGFREAYNWFPNEIYYSAIPNDVHKYFDDDAKDLRRDSSPVQPVDTSLIVRHEQKYNQGPSQRSINTLKEELQQEFKKELQEQLKAQQDMFEAQTRKLYEQMSTLIYSSKV
ncbi:Mitogen-activated protein kinase [Haplosporangium sp. Z 767]|nr:Mitogen-activated protein kinase [Haplosporangium sp. Z 767]